LKLSLSNLQFHTTRTKALNSDNPSIADANTALFDSLPPTAILDHLIKWSFTQIGEDYPSHRPVAH
jgi:hypothetical protein